jgi:hypothetical protein
MNPIVTKILKLADRGQSASDIAAAVSKSPGYVYSVLREHRPDRQRKAHKTRSDNPRMIAGCTRSGHQAGAHCGGARRVAGVHLQRIEKGGSNLAL